MARTSFGMSAREVFDETPQWELEVLIAKHNEANSES